MPIGLGIAASPVMGAGRGRPNWVPGNASLYSDFVSGQYWDGSESASSGVTDTHAETIYAEDASGLWVAKTANVLCRTDAGLQTVPTRTNLFLNSFAPVTQNVTVSSGAAYTVSIEGAGSVELSDAGTGTATDGSPVTITTSTTTLTCTVSGADATSKVNVTTGVFAVPPIETAGTSATVNGNVQTLDLTGRVSGGLCGFLKIDAKQLAAAAGPRSINFFNSAAPDADRVQVAAVSGDLVRLNSLVGGAVIGAMDGGTWALGEITFAFAIGDGFRRFRVVGNAQVADSLGTLPPLDTVALGGNGVSAVNNIYQIAKKLALRFGPVDQAVFDGMFAQAELA